MSENKQIILLRIAYWVGAIMDGLVGLNMVLATIFGNISPFIPTPFTGGTSYQFAMGFCASFMIAWTVLLIWADRKPVARKDILIITAVPVVGGFTLVEFFGLYLQTVILIELIPMLVIRSALIILLVGSYIWARNLVED